MYSISTTAKSATREKMALPYTVWAVPPTPRATSAYMLAQNIAEAATGIEKLVARVLVLAE